MTKTVTFIMIKQFKTVLYTSTALEISMAFLFPLQNVFSQFFPISIKEDLKVSTSEIVLFSYCFCVFLHHKRFVVFSSDEGRGWFYHAAKKINRIWPSSPKSFFKFCSCLPQRGDGAWRLHFN